VRRQILQGLDDVVARPRVVGLGSFDGVHLGHRAVIERAVADAAGRELPALVATFHPLPRSVVDPPNAPPSLSSLATRIGLIADLGPNEILILRFTRELAAVGAEAFVRDVLVQRLAAQEVVVGANFRFGYDRSGDVALLERLGAAHGFAVTPVPLVVVDGERVSSSRIRGLVLAGEVEAAARLLGRPPALEGAVVRGDGRGRQIGMPTANLGFPPGHVTPSEGVYAGYAVLAPGVRRLPAAISVGRNETFGGTPSVRVEAHILDLDEDLYGLPMRVEFVRRLRGQVRYDGVEELVAQMVEDVAETRRLVA
jgi:riboflavin kinase / FMN adenylyltransferase